MQGGWGIFYTVSDVDYSLMSDLALFLYWSAFFPIKPTPATISKLAPPSIGRDGSAPIHEGSPAGFPGGQGWENAAKDTKTNSNVREFLKKKVDVFLANVFITVWFRSI